MLPPKDTNMKDPNGYVPSALCAPKVTDAMSITMAPKIIITCDTTYGRVVLPYSAASVLAVLASAAHLDKLATCACNWHVPHLTSNAASSWFAQGTHSVLSLRSS